MLLQAEHVDEPQVILRPSLSTRGRSNRQRLFLSHPSEKLVFDVCLDRPTHQRAKPGEGKQGEDSNLDAGVKFFDNAGWPLL